MKGLVLLGVLAVCPLIANAGERLVPMPLEPIVPGDIKVSHFLDQRADGVSSNLEILHYAKGIADSLVYMSLAEGSPLICVPGSRVSWKTLDLILNAEVRRLEYAGKTRHAIGHMPLTEFVHGALLHHYACEVK